jgi:hypothetical protein
VANKTQRRSLITFHRDAINPHPLAQRNTKQQQNFSGRDMTEKRQKGTCKPGHTAGLIALPRDIGHRGNFRPEIPED